MKSDVMHASAQVDLSILNNIVEVKETIAQVKLGRRARKFGVYDLWNIRKDAKLASSRARRF